MIPVNTFDEYHFSNYIRATFKFKEGNIIMTDNVAVGGESRNPTLTNQLRVGDYVKLVPGERLTVEKVDDFENDVIIGKVHAKGEFDGVGPLEDAVYGDYDSRKGTIIINAKAFKTYKLGPKNKAIAVGDPIQVVGVEYNPHTHEMDTLVDKGTNDNETYATTEVAANTPDSYVDVLHEFMPINGK